MPLTPERLEHTGVAEVDFFGCERSFWTERYRPNMLMVHYNDMKSDLEGEMRKIAAFLNVDCASELWPQLVEAASFESMQRDGALLMPQRVKHRRIGRPACFR